MIDFNSKNFEKAIKLSRLDELINSFEEKENKVEILVLDEPTSALDKINEDKIIEDLNALNSSTKITILLISHKESVFKHCNKKISLDDNK